MTPVSPVHAGYPAGDSDSQGTAGDQCGLTGWIAADPGRLSEVYGSYPRTSLIPSCNIGDAGIRYPNVKSYTLTPELRNSTTNSRSAIFPDCRIIWYIRASLIAPAPSSSISAPCDEPGE